MLTDFVVLAGFIHLGIVVMNLFLPRVLNVREEIQVLDPFFQEMFTVHWVYIVVTVGFLGILCVGMSHLLVMSSPLALALNGFIAVFWGARVIIQFFYYGTEMKRKYWYVHYLFTGSILYVSGLFSWLSVRWLI